MLCQHIQKEEFVIGLRVDESFSKKGWQIVLPTFLDGKGSNAGLSVCTGELS